MVLPIRLHQSVSQVTGVKRHSLPAGEGVANLAKQIRAEWNFLSPEEQAAKVIELEGRVSRLPEGTPGLEKTKRLAEELHFQFVFPIVRDLRGSFTKTIRDLAREISRTQSVQLLKTLSLTQQKEVIAAARGGA